MTAKLTSPFLILIAVGTILGCSPTAPVQNASKAQIAANSQSRDDPNSPEAALRKFIVAVTVRDAEAIKAVTLPHEKLDVLWAGGPAPPEAAASVSFANMHITSLKVGHKIRLPSGGTLVLDDALINENRRQLTLHPDPFPFEIVRSEGQWKVNAEGLIEGRSEQRAAAAQNPAEKSGN